MVILARSLLGVLTAATLACAPPPLEGRFGLLTYNVAGLPQGMSRSNPAVNTPLISPLLNHHDLVLVQEDFSYHYELGWDALHPHRSYPAEPVARLINDGLNRFSQLAFAEHRREMWQQCSGVEDRSQDCLAEKGFAHARTTLAEGVEVDVYNLHMDAGRAPEDHAARASQVEQLLAAIATRSADRALIVAGDTNLKRDSAVDDAGLLDQLLEGAGLRDSCAEIACGDDRIDRVLLRDDASLTWTVESWGTDLRFVDADGHDLSDHLAVAVGLGWRSPTK